MSAVNEQIAREYFEAHGFFVKQAHKYIVMARNKRAAEEIDLIIVKPAQVEQILPPETLWTGRSLAGIGCAVVSVRGWHTERFSAQTLELSQQLFRFAMPEAVASVKPLVGDAPVAKIMCLPDLPSSPQPRQEALDVIRARGVDGVILFPTMVRELAAALEVSNNYEKSDVLQLLRIIKNYDLFRDEQLELFNRRKKPTKKIATAN